MSTPPAPALFAMPRLEPAFGPVRAAAAVGAAQRASLGRGLVFMLLLAASSLASVYVPIALGGPDWVEGSAPPPRAAAR